LKIGTCGLSSLMLGVNGWLQGNSSRALPVQHSLQKHLRGGNGRQQAEMGAADHP